VSGVTMAAFRMVGPIYGIEVGLTKDLIALFLSAFVIGGALVQLPLGWLADRFDRRHVLIVISVGSTPACWATIAVAHMGTVAVFAGAAFFGATSLPIYSLSAAHAHDFASDDERVELSAALMFLYAVGAIASPTVASWLIEAYGASAMFVFLSAIHVLLVVFGLLRMRARPVPDTRTPYVYTPRTSFLIGRLLRRTGREG